MWCIFAWFCFNIINQDHSSLAIKIYFFLKREPPLLQSLLWPTFDLHLLKHLLYTVTETFIIYFVLLNCLFICWASLDFQLLDGQGFVFPMAFHCLRQCIVFSKIIHVCGISTVLLGC